MFKNHCDCLKKAGKSIVSPQNHRAQNKGAGIISINYIINQL